MIAPVLALLAPWLAGLYGALALADEALPGGPLLTKAIGGALVLHAGLAFRQRPSAPWRSLVLPLALLAAWSAASLLWSLDPAATRARAAHLGLEALLLAALCAAPDRRRLLSGLALGAAAASIAILAGFAWGLAGAEHARVHPFGEHGNLAARDAVIGALVAAFVLRPRWLGVVAAAAGIALGISHSAGAALATLAACGVLALRDARRWRPLVLGLVLGTLFGGAALSGVAAQRTKLRSVTDALHGNAREEIGSGRLVLWGHAARVARAHPILGVGAGAFPEAMERGRVAHQRTGGEHSKPRRRAHSIYLDLLAETGPIGLLAFVALLVALGRAAWRRQDDLAGALLAFVIVSAATDSLLQQRSLWLALGAAALIPRADD